MHDAPPQEAKLQDLAKETRRLRDRLRYMDQQLRRYREGDIVIAADNDQGRKIHEALSEDPDVTDMFAKLPEGSLARAVVEASRILGGSVCVCAANSCVAYWRKSHAPIKFVVPQYSTR